MSLKERALLVSLSIEKPKLTEKDKGATLEVAVDKNASVSAVAVVKKLYPKHLLAPITQVESLARRYVESVTQPWCRGLALLPSALFMDFQRQIGVFKLQFEQAVTVFLNNYSTVMMQAGKEQGELFNAAEYPDFSSLRRDFSFGVTYMPLSDASSIVLDLEASTLAQLRADVEQQTKNTLAESQKVLYNRLADAVKRIATQCGKEEGRIYESLTGNLADMLKILPYLNLSDDPNFAALCKEAETLVISPIALKTVPEVRTNTARKANEILAAMEEFL